MPSNTLGAINPISEQTVKNHLPVARFAVSDTGAVTVVMPDRRQPRLYQVMSLELSGDLRPVGSFSMEKLRRIDFSVDATVIAAATDDDLYLFSGGAKTRLLPERRDIYTGLSVAPAGTRLVVSSANLIRSNHSITLQLLQDGPVWVMDIPFPVSDVRVSQDCTRILAVSDDGPAIMVDDSRSVVWQLDSSDPVTAADVSLTGEASLLGCRSGMLRMVGDSGDIIWESHRADSISGYAVCANGRFSVAAYGVTLEALSEDGAVIAEHIAPSPILSVALSPSGTFAAVSCAGGILQALELSFDATRTHAEHKAVSLRAQAERALADGDWASAVDSLAAYLELRPSDVEACRELAEASIELADKLLLDVDHLLDERRLAEAAAAMNKARSLLPHQRVSAVQSRILNRALREIAKLSRAGRLEEVIEKAREAVMIDPMDWRPREALANAESALAARYSADAETMLESGNIGEAIAVLEKAAGLTPSDELNEKLAKARARQSFDDGLALYEAKKFSQAVFRFRKALTLDPSLAEAQKYIDYSEGLSRQNDMISDRFSKLE